MAIRILDKDLVNKIAAGEVIERPASVVKELIENAIDAWADTIIIEVKEGGKVLIRVTDNGMGMDNLDLNLSFKEHATSKIADTKDLFNVKSLGFRGEALASIAAVSRLDITSRTAEDSKGRTISVEGGEKILERECGCPVGTSVSVKELFFNTPARRKHLKSDSLESSHIIDIVTRYALSNKSLSMVLLMDGKEIMNLPKTGNLLNKIVSIYGKDIAKQMVELSYIDNLVKISGFVGKPYLTRKDKSLQTFFVNGRYVKNQTISNAIYDAYHTLLFLDRNPACLLFIEIDTGKTDVNVHPQKEIIRIEDEDEVYKSIFNAIREAFDKNSLVPEVQVSSFPTNRKPSKQYTLVTEKQEVLAPVEEKKQPVPDRKIGPIRILGQINRLYIVAEGREGLLIIDQHAAEERVYFERFMNEYNDRSISRQKLLKPKIIDVTMEDAVLIEANIHLLETLGFSVEEYGKRTYRITQIPQILGKMDDDLIRDLIHELGKKSATEKVEERIAKMACRRAVKAGDVLTMPQMEELLIDLDSCEKPYSCPHGRPTIISIPIAELEQKFKRTV